MMSVIHITNSQPLKVHELKHLSYTWGLLDKTFGLYEWRLKSFVTTASNRFRNSWRDVPNVMGSLMMLPFPRSLADPVPG